MEISRDAASRYEHKTWLRRNEYFKTLYRKKKSLKEDCKASSLEQIEEKWLSMTKIRQLKKRVKERRDRQKKLSGLEMPNLR